MCPASPIGAPVHSGGPAPVGGGPGEQAPRGSYVWREGEALQELQGIQGALTFWACANPWLGANLMTLFPAKVRAPSHAACPLFDTENCPCVLVCLATPGDVVPAPLHSLQASLSPPAPVPLQLEIVMGLDETQSFLRDTRQARRAACMTRAVRRASAPRGADCGLIVCSRRRVPQARW